MESAFKIWATNRKFYSDFLEKYSLAQLNTIPEGFSNNLIWNIGHIIVAQQGLVYKASNLPMNISDALYEQYKNGTKPSQATTQAEVDELKALLTPLMEKTKRDFASGSFVSYNTFTTGTGFHLASTAEAIEFNNYHEGLHLGFMMNIHKFV
jgi:hypothetical protein